MLKRSITYTDFDDNEITETFYFNISEPELLELEVDVEGGLHKMMQSIIDAEDHKRILAMFKKIILLAYGNKSDDGKRFMKSDEIRKDFEHSAAYIALYTELASDANAGAAFMNGLLPAKLVAQMVDQDKPTAPPAFNNPDQPNMLKDPHGLSG